MKLIDLIQEHKDENKDISKAPPPDSEWITTAQAAKMLGVTMSRIRQMIMDGQISSKSPIKGRRDNLVSRKTITALSKKERKPTGRPEGT
jgi:excisionase family DNA binding protein